MKKFFLLWAPVLALSLCWLPSCASYGSDMWFYETMRTSGAEGLKLQIEQHKKKSAERAQEQPHAAPGRHKPRACPPRRAGGRA